MSHPINGEELFKSKWRQFNANASHDRFRDDYLGGLNDSLSEMGVSLDTSYSTIGDTETNLTVGTAMDEVTLKAGLDYYITLRGAFSSGDLTLGDARIAFESALRLSMAARDTASTAAATNEGTIGFLTGSDQAG